MILKEIIYMAAIKSVDELKIRNSMVFVKNLEGVTRFAEMYAATVLKEGAGN
jgi:hypothetical protein